MIRWWEHSQKGVTDRQTDGQTENTIHRAAWSQLKTPCCAHLLKLVLKFLPIQTKSPVIDIINFQYYRNHVSHMDGILNCMDGNGDKTESNVHPNFTRNWYHVAISIELTWKFHKDYITFPWHLCTGVNQCTFHWLISNDIALRWMVLDSLIVHDLIIITLISYEIIFTISLSKINIAPL